MAGRSSLYMAPWASHLIWTVPEEGRHVTFVEEALFGLGQFSERNSVVSHYQPTLLPTSNTVMKGPSGWCITDSITYVRK